MLKLLLALGGGLAVHAFHVHRQKAGQHLLAPGAPSLPAPALPAGPGQLTPARAAVHGELMAKCHDPAKLMKAASMFGAENLPHHAQALANKAEMLHNMIHVAKSLVERCRVHDQHAMAIVQGIGEQAKAGNKRAQLSSWLIQEYTKANPNTQQQAA